MSDMPPPPHELGAFFAPQYYGLLCTEPNNMHHFYAEHSTMVLVRNGETVTTATHFNEIHKLIMSLDFVVIETESIHSRVSFDCVCSDRACLCLDRAGVLLVVSGFVKIKDKPEYRNFVHTMYLAPQGSGYFIMNDILHIITHDHHYVTNHLNPEVPLKYEDIHARFHSEHPPPDNGNLDESEMEKFELLKSLMVNELRFPTLKQQQLLLRQGRKGSGLQTQRVVSETPPAQDEASSSCVAPVIEPVAVQEELSKLGEFFAPQYYGLFSKEPNNMHYFYSKDSTMILVINGKTITAASKIDQIHNLIMLLKFVTIETKSIHSRVCWGHGVLLVVSGFVKIKDVTEFCIFVHTMYLAPQGNGYFIMNDILHIITNHHVKDHLIPVAPLTSKDIDPRFYSKHQPPVMENGNLDESAVKKFEQLMSEMVNNIQFPIKPNVREDPPAQEEASSSKSSSVANADDAIHENMDALKIEETLVVQEEPSHVSVEKP